MAHKHIERLNQRIEILEAALDLQADPTNELKKAKLAALMEPTLQGAIAKALVDGQQSMNLLPLLLDARKARGGSASGASAINGVNIEKGKQRAAEGSAGPLASSGDITDRIRKKAAEIKKERS
jgi:hypothetical protein